MGAEAIVSLRRGVQRREKAKSRLDLGRRDMLIGAKMKAPSIDFLYEISL
jgi:hypothetical protein